MVDDDRCFVGQRSWSLLATVVLPEPVPPAMPTKNGLMAPCIPCGPISVG